MKRTAWSCCLFTLLVYERGADGRRPTLHADRLMNVGLSNFGIDHPEQGLA